MNRGGITMQDLMERFQLSQYELDAEMGPEHLHDCAKLFDDYEIVGAELGLDEPAMTAIRDDEKTQERKRMALLKKWKQVFAWRATYRCFIDALLNCGRADCACNVCKLLARSVSPEGSRVIIADSVSFTQLQSMPGAISVYRPNHVQANGILMHRMKRFESISNGLKIRVHGNEQSFDCRPSPLVTTIQDTGWVRLLYIVPSPKKHILCRNMPNATNVFSFLRAVSEGFTVAVLVIASNKMSLADWSIFGDKEMPSIPIFVVSSEVGQQIVERLEDDHLAYARICGREVKTISRDRLLEDMAATVDVFDYLKHVKLEKLYTQQFKEQDVDGIFLWSICREKAFLELKAIGIPKPHHRRLIVSRFEDYLTLKLEGYLNIPHKYLFSL